MSKDYRFKHYHSHHTFARPLAMRYFNNPKDPAFKKLPFKVRLAWRLRMLATRLDEGFTIKLEGTIPPGLTPDDFLNALEYGLLGVQAYMADEAQERSIQLADPDKKAG